MVARTGRAEVAASRPDGVMGLRVLPRDGGSCECPASVVAEVRQRRSDHSLRTWHDVDVVSPRMRH
jgi:hypothetical protein